MNPELTIEKRLKIAIGGLRSIAYGDPRTWPNANATEVAKQALADCGGEKQCEYSETAHGGTVHQPKE